jgi:hypothetical protein
LVLIGNGDGFDQRLAFRATIDERQDPPRRLYAYYVEDRTIWQETRTEDDASCLAEADRATPDPRRIALTPRAVTAFALGYLDRNGEPTTAPAAVRSIRITLVLETESTPGQRETQTYQTVVTVRSP